MAGIWHEDGREERGENQVPVVEVLYIEALEAFKHILIVVANCRVGFW